MKIKELTQTIETLAPLHLQESYDNSGLIIGNPEAEVQRALIAVDITDKVIDEAISQQCGLIISHHPLIFKGLKKITVNNAVERMAIRCIKNDIAIYAAHTNLDNVQHGVNKIIGEKIGLTEMRILDPKAGMLRKLVTFCPDAHADKVRAAIFSAGAGHIGNYDSCSFNLSGQGSFRALDGANPFVGKVSTLHFESEQRIETIFPVYRQTEVLRAMFAAHPYEEVAYDIYPLENESNNAGAGIIGKLKKPEPTMEFLKRIKNAFKTNCLRHTKLIRDEVQIIAVCGGSGSFLTQKAIYAAADVFVTGDVKYHEFFDADNNIILADLGHYESEQFTSELIKSVLLEKFPNFAALISEVNTNPVFYLT
jgi:dinuclear metal center YbgI/SA1388 family protein